MINLIRKLFDIFNELILSEKTSRISTAYFLLYNFEIIYPKNAVPNFEEVANTTSTSFENFIVKNKDLIK